MRDILHAKFGDHRAKLSFASDKVPSTNLSPPPRDSSVEEFAAALTKARAAWRASRGRTRTTTCNAMIARRRQYQRPDDAPGLGKARTSNHPRYGSDVHFERSSL
jgi:hypothetical protein